jgi:photosystem II stability/assembly factor-like uncharacterized protein
MSDRILAGTRKGVFIIDRGTDRWAVTHHAFPGVPAPSVLHDPRDGTLYAGLGHGHFGPKMHRSADGGANWEEIACPVYPERPEDSDDVDPWTKKPREWKTKELAILQAGHPDTPGRIYCGTIPGGLFRSDDRGDTWQLDRNLWNHPLRPEWFGGGTEYPSLHSVCVNPTDPNHVVVGISCGGVWVTRDGGESWNVKAKGMRANFMPPEKADYENNQDPHFVVQCAAKPEHFWTQHHCGIWRSTDDCESWVEITEAGPSTFGFAVAVHPNDSNTAWFVPADNDTFRIPVDGKVVVTRTRDGGKSFDVLTEGLPQEHAFDLTYRHALDIDVDGSGEQLAFGSTTGSLWVTDNGGDTWQTISQHLPPIYAVRFAK